MNKKYNEISLLLMIFFIGYFGLFSYLSHYIPQLFIYFTIMFVWIFSLKDYIIKGVKEFKKEYFNEALSIVVVMMIISSLLMMMYHINETYNQESWTLLIISSLIYAPI